MVASGCEHTLIKAGHEPLTGWVIFCFKNHEFAPEPLEILSFAFLLAVHLAVQAFMFPC